MVKQIQVTDEFYDLQEDDEDTLSIFVAPDYYETDEQLVIIAFLMLLEQRYRLLQSMTLEQIQDEVEEIMTSLLDDFNAIGYVQAESHIQKYFRELLSNYNVPDKYVEMDYSMLDLMSDSLRNMVTQLTGEIQVKTKFFQDNMSKDTFDLLPNFRRAIQKTVDAVGSNLIHGKEKSKRNVYEFVYGEDKLYRWFTANDDKVCGWCRIQESMPPRTLREMPLDHPRGRCVIDPIDYTYSNEYYIMLARGEYADQIETYMPDDESMSRAGGRRL